VTIVAICVYFDTPLYFPWVPKPTFTHPAHGYPKKNLGYPRVPISGKFKPLIRGSSGQISTQLTLRTANEKGNFVCPDSLQITRLYRAAKTEEPRLCGIEVSVAKMLGLRGDKVHDQTRKMKDSDMAPV